MLLIVGTGVWEPKYIIYANGDKTHKSISILPSGIKATAWKDSKNKTKQGKLVYIVRNDANGIEFDTTKHTLTTKAEKTIATVSSKGIVSAKAAGTAYVYICDTGSMTWEMYPVVVEASPAKIYISDVPGSYVKEALVKTAILSVGSARSVYVVPYTKDGASTDKCTYTVLLAKAADAQYLSVGAVTEDATGHPKFTVIAKSTDTDKNKTVSVKVVVTCVESGKKASMTVVVTNPVSSVGVEIGSGDLDKKKDVVNIDMNIMTAAGAGIKTTDKLKLYVSSGDITLDNKKVIVERGATVKVKMDKSGTKFSLTAGKDAGTAAKIGLLVTDQKAKTNKLFMLVEVDEKGNVRSLTQ